MIGASAHLYNPSLWGQRPVARGSQGIDHPMDDEFTDSSFNTSLWAEWDPSGSNLLSPSEDPAGLKLSCADNPASTENWMGVYQAIPSGGDDEFEFITRAGFSAPAGQFAMAGLLLLEDPGGAPTTSDLLALAVRGNTSGPDVALAARYGSYTGGGIVTVGSSPFTLGTAYLCFQWKISTGKYCAYWSADGINWLKLITDTAHGMAAAPTAIGLGCNAYQRDMVGRFEFFRVKSGSSGVYNQYPDLLAG
jgi:hypothetical protein